MQFGTGGKYTLAISVGVGVALLVNRCFLCHCNYMTTKGYINLETENGEVERKKSVRRQERKQVLNLVLGSINCQ